MTTLRQCSLEEEGYTVSQQSNFTPPETIVQKVVETLSLKELSEINGTQYNKVSNYIPYQQKITFCLMWLSCCFVNLTSLIFQFFSQKHFFCNVKILNVEKGNWWYDSCSDCEGEVEKVEGKFKCTNCTNKTILVPEKRLVCNFQNLITSVMISYF